MCKTCHDTGKLGNRFCLCKAGGAALAAYHRAQESEVMARWIPVLHRTGQPTRLFELPAADSAVLHRLVKQGVLQRFAGNTFALPVAGPTPPPPACTAESLYHELLRDLNGSPYAATSGVMLEWYNDLGATSDLFLTLWAEGKIDLFQDARGHRRARLALVDQPQPESNFHESKSD